MTTTNIYADSLVEKRIYEKDIFDRELQVSLALDATHCPGFRRLRKYDLETQSLFYDKYPVNLEKYHIQNIQEFKSFIWQILNALTCAQEKLNFMHNNLAHLTSFVVDPANGEVMIINYERAYINPINYSVTKDVVDVSHALELLYNRSRFEDPEVAALIQKMYRGELEPWRALQMLGSF